MLTLVSAIVFHSIILSLLFIAIQFCAFVWCAVGDFVRCSIHCRRRGSMQLLRRPGAALQPRPAGAPACCVRARLRPCAPRVGHRSPPPWLPRLLRLLCRYTASYIPYAQSFILRIVGTGGGDDGTT